MLTIVGCLLSHVAVLALVFFTIIQVHVAYPPADPYFSGLMAAYGPPAIVSTRQTAKF